MKEMVEKNKILTIRGGSHLYGTNTPESDTDYISVFIPTIDYIIGFKRIEQVDLSVKDKINDKNTPNAVDETAYSIDRFLQLALDNNPNILELFFVNEENIIFINEIGRELLNIRSSLVSKNTKHRFAGYAFSQKHKMIIKLENYEKLHEAIKYLQESTVDYVNDIKFHPLFIRKKKDMFVGDINIPASTTRKNAINILYKHVGKYGHRTELTSKYGFDTKFAMHLIRLMQEGIELLKTGSLQFPLTCKEHLLNIRSGKYALNEIIAYSEYLEDILENVTTSLPHSPNYRAVEEFIMKVYKDKINERI